ncbi:MYND-type domain-containing protein [Mycena chlorophos]|uniref:MYND-type domain-containing protein n=1 Tax=Mycena chlorophos TaxID=658473 RepID=A0A8H6S885_MYCCL|nr:MYND-type domain-containing protein [Mycena chlorophos]
MLHPSLQLGNVRKLPENPRKAALAAASGSLPALLKLFAFLNATRDGAAMRYSVPVIYACLNTDGLDTLRYTLANSVEIDYDVEIAPALTLVRHSLRLLPPLCVESAIESAAFQAFWHRAWAWISFLQEFSAHVITSDTQRLEDYRLAVGIFATAVPNPEYAAVLVDSPRLLVFVGAAWSVLIHRSTFDLTYQQDIDALGTLFQWIQSTNLALLRGDIWSLVEGTGGSWATFARSVFAPPFSAPLSSERLRYITLVLAFLAIGINHPESIFAFLEAGMINRVIAVLHSICQMQTLATVPEEFANVATVLVNSLVTAFDSSYLHRCAQDFFSAGLSNELELFLSYARLLNAHEVKEGFPLTDLHFIIERALPLIATRRASLAKLVPAVQSLRSQIADGALDLAQYLPDDGLRQKWERLMNAVDGREQMVTVLRNRSMVWSRACDVCFAMGEKALFKRCGGCKAAFYCSKECQRKGWSSGHRSICNPALRILQIPGDSVGMSVQDRSFIRVLLDKYYAAHIDDLGNYIVKWLRVFGHKTNSYPIIYFDFTHAPCFISTSVLTDGNTVAAQESVLRKRFPGVFRAVAQSRGRMQLHVVRLAYRRNATDVERGLEWVPVPLRVAETTWYDGLRELATVDEGDLDDAALLVRIKELSAETIEIPWAHQYFHE